MLIHSDRLLKTAPIPPAKLEPWLNHPVSLTDKLRAATASAELKVLRQGWSVPNWWDKFTLGLLDEEVLHREILMYSRGTPCWYARTIIPKSSYLNNESFFERLKEGSLGQLLFSEPTIKRTLLLNYAIDWHCLEYAWLPADLRDSAQQYWLRLSLYTVADTSALCLVEILLPGLRELI